MVFWSAVALAALYVAFEAGWTAGVRWRHEHWDRDEPCPTCGFHVRRVPRRSFVFDDEDRAEAEAMAAEILRRQSKP